jgi:hypothetical protein
MNVNDACAFFTELILKYKVPAEMHYSTSNTMRIHIPRESIPGGMTEKIQEEALKRGFSDHSGDKWISFGG